MEGIAQQSLGRKKAFVWSIVIMTIPTFAMGCLPTYAKCGIIAPLLLGVLRLLQSIPSAGEAAGTACYLYEFSDQGNRRYITSWAGVGNQIGAMIGIIEIFLLDYYSSEDFLMSWGWRISFWSGGLIGLFGIYLRRKLHETPVFAKLREHDKLNKETVGAVIRKYKKAIGIGIAFGALNASAYYLIAIYIPAYFNQMLGLNVYWNVIISLLILILTTVLLPFFGKLGDKFSNKYMLIGSSLVVLICLPRLYVSINKCELVSIAIIGVLCLLAITCITALITYRLSSLFPTSVRFTGVGLAFNLADGIIGGFTPAIALFLLHFTLNQAAFCWIILLCGIISLISYLFIKE